MAIIALLTCGDRDYFSLTKSDQVSLTGCQKSREMALLTCGDKPLRQTLTSEQNFLAQISNVELYCQANPNCNRKQFP